jgi:RNA polymerase sigma-70 factor (ECF subfamily)
VSQQALQEEFIQLLANQQKLIHSLCRLYYPLAEDRKDIFQEIVLNLWKSYPAFKKQSKVSTWIYRVSLNTIFSRIRKEKNLPKSESYSEKIAQIPNSEDTMALDDATQALYEAIYELPQADKALILLYLEEHTYQEIATLLEMTKTNVSTRINRIKSKLEKLLKMQLP